MKVELMCHSGDDLLVINAARASFGKESDWGEVIVEAGNTSNVLDRRLSERDKKLINYLAREKHVLPFRHPQITLRCKAPIFLCRQLGKHQVGMSWSEESRRYITTEPEFFWPDKWRKKADNVKQGSSDEEVSGKWTTSAFGLAVTDAKHEAEYMQATALACYENMLSYGVAPELARMVLPQNMMVTWVWTGSLLSFYQLYKLRSEAHAQREARDFAEMVKDVIAPLYPESWKALEEHV